MDDRVELAKKFTEMGFKVGAEVGVNQGKYSAYLLETVPGLKLYSIDNWEGKYQGAEEIATEKLSKYPGSTILRGDSVEVSSRIADETLDFIYIDGDHTEWGVERDLKAWMPKVKKGGIISGHDWQLPAVRGTLKRLINKERFVIINPQQRYPSWYFIND